MAKFIEIKSIDSMISFLEEKGKNHDYYYHYTNWDSLTKIFQYETFLLTRGNSLCINDQNEALMKGSRDEWNKIFIGSFAFGSSEIMAMWGLYGIPWEDAIRLSIPKKEMLQWIRSIKSIKLFENGITEDYHSDFDVRLNDIVYVSGKRGEENLRLTHRNKSITVSETYPLYGIDTAKRMTGFIKNYAWQYENEVRLRIRLAHNTGYERISVDIPEEVINSISITTGPGFKWKNDELYDRLIAQNRISISGFDNLVKYKKLCDMCQHSFEIR